MRPGNSASSTLKRSATIKGAWFGSITPPEPTRMCVRHRRDLPDHDVGRRACDRRQVVMLGDPIAHVAEAVGEAREVQTLLSAAAPDEPDETGDRSSTESGGMGLSLPD